MVLEEKILMEKDPLSFQDQLVIEEESKELKNEEDKVDH
jgi:hypothetical protein